MFAKCLYYGARQIAYLPSARVYALGKYYYTRRIPGFRSGTSMFVVVLFFEKKNPKNQPNHIATHNWEYLEIQNRER